MEMRQDLQWEAEEEAVRGREGERDPEVTGLQREREKGVTARPAAELTRPPGPAAAGGRAEAPRSG